jgi:hypothetical protein
MADEPLPEQALSVRRLLRPEQPFALHQLLGPAAERFQLLR